MTTITLGIPGNVADVMAEYILAGNRYGVFNKAMAGEPITILEMLAFGGVITPITEGKGKKKKDVAYVIYWIDKPYTSVHKREEQTLTFMGIEEGNFNQTPAKGLEFFRKYWKEGQ